MVNISRLRWGAWNIAHMAKHGITPDEVEVVCHNKPLVQRGKKGRLLVFGPTKTGRMITAVLDPEGKNTYYPVTTRSTSRKERKIYKSETEVKE